jgi:ribokinase
METCKIAVIGSLNMDIVVKVSRFPVGGETILGNEIHFIPGGKGANQAVAAARLGAQTTMLGAVGNDQFGSALLESLKNNHVGIDYIKQMEQTPTGVASILLSPDENHIVVVPGANGLLMPNDIERLEDVIAEADIVLLQLEIPLETVNRATEIAKKFGKRIILNPAPACMLSEELLQRVDYIIPNKSEIEELTGLDLSKHSLEAAVDALLAKGPQYVITTLGAEGVVWKQKGGQMKVHPACRVPVVDTTGAGDAFSAGLAYYLAMGNSLEHAVHSSIKVSALAVTKFGAQEGMPTREQVEEYEEQNG